MKKEKYTSPVIEFRVLEIDIMFARGADNFGEYIWGEGGDING
jgi:hypothetical protein